MATFPPTPPPQPGGPGAPGGGSPPPSGDAGGGQPQILQIVAIITRATDAMAKSMPATAPMADEIQNQLRLAQAKIAQTMQPTQPSAPPI